MSTQQNDAERVELRERLAQWIAEHDGDFGGATDPRFLNYADDLAAFVGLAPQEQGPREPEPGTVEARFDWLCREVEKRSPPEYQPYMSNLHGCPEQAIIMAYDRLAGAAPLLSPEGREREGKEIGKRAIAWRVLQGAVKGWATPDRPDLLVITRDELYDVVMRALTSPTESRGPNDR